jgi:hypothetical protein
MSKNLPEGILKQILKEFFEKAFIFPFVLQVMVRTAGPVAVY